MESGDDVENDEGWSIPRSCISLMRCFPKDDNTWYTDNGCTWSRMAFPDVPHVMNNRGDANLKISRTLTTSRTRTFANFSKNCIVLLETVKFVEKRNKRLHSTINSDPNIPPKLREKKMVFTHFIGKTRSSHNDNEHFKFLYNFLL